MTRTNSYQIIDSLLAEIDRLNQVIASLQEQQEQTTAPDNTVNVSSVNDQPLTTSPRLYWVKQTPDPELLKLKSHGITTFINPDHPFAKDCGSCAVTIIEKGEDTSIVAETTGLIEGQWLHTTEVNNNCLEYFNRDYNKLVAAKQPLTVNANSLMTNDNDDLDEFAADFEEELSEESIVSLAFDDLNCEIESDKLVLELDRALNKVSCLKEDKDTMLKAISIELLGSDFNDDDSYDRRYKLFRSAIASSVEAMKFEISRRTKK